MASRRPKKQPADGSALIATRPTRGGGAAPRCQAVKKDGVQCGSYAVTGKRVCPKHGGGMPAREARDGTRPTGRPPTHGLYSQRGQREIADIVAELQEADIDLDDTDEEMRLMRATISYLVRQGPTISAVVERAGEMIEELRALAEGGEPLTPQDAYTIARAVGGLERAMTRGESYARVLIEATRHTVGAVKNRAETTAKAAEARALDSLTRFVAVLRGILWDVLDDEQLDVVEERLRREVFIPAGVAMPDVEEKGITA
jgi:hypothetical protein